MPPLFAKLNHKDSREVFVLNAPQSFERELAQLEGVRVKRKVGAGARVDFAIAFATTQAGLDSVSASLARAAHGDAILWFAYPKGTSKRYTCEFNRDRGWSVLTAAGFEGVRMVAIDEDWSALRFRRVEYIPVLTRATHRKTTARPKGVSMHPEIQKYNRKHEPNHRAVCERLAQEIHRNLPEAESKIWHAHPVWFLDGNPTVGYSHQKRGIRLMFWSGADFDEPELRELGKKFKDASVFFNEASEIKQAVLRRWLHKAREIQWDYKNIVKRRGRLERLK